MYLIAWHKGEPVGHFLLRWEGLDTETSEHNLYPTPYLKQEAPERLIDERVLQPD